MRQTILVILITCSAIALTLLQASEVDQFQDIHTLYSDWGHGSGQVFIPATRGLLTGLEFVIKDNHNPGTIEVYLWKADATGRPIEPKLATAYLDKTDVTSPTSSWYSVQFDQPYAQSPGERLAFTIFLLTFGGNGWNDYGLVNTDTYTNGFRIYYESPYFGAYPDSDWTFRTLVIPSPEIDIAGATATGLTITTPSSEPDAQYVMQTCSNLPQGAWSNIATNFGDGSALSWDVQANGKRQKFFRLNVQKRE